MKTYKIAVIPGDGVGPEVLTEGIKVLKRVAELDGTFQFEDTWFPWGCEYYLKTGRMMPEDGIVLSVSAQSGAQTAKDAVLATYCPAQDVELVCPVDEEDLPAVKIGARVRVVLEAYEDAPIEGEVVSIASAADENGAFAVAIRLLEDANVRIGMSAMVEL